MTDRAFSLFLNPSPEEWWRLAGLVSGIGLLIALAELSRARFRWPPEVPRKIVHVVIGIVVLLLPGIFLVPLPALLLCILFIVVNFVAVREGLLKGIHGTERPSYGTVYYPLAVLILVMLFWYRQPWILQLSVLVLAIGDTAGTIIGGTHKAPTVYSLTSDKKSLEGTLAMFLVSFTTLAVGLQTMSDGNLPLILVLTMAGVAALTATSWEALSSHGLDNLTIPLSVAFVLAIYLIPLPNANIRQYTLGSGLAIGVSVASWYARFLTAGGAVATFLLASVIFGIGGWKWTVPILVFFVLSSILSRIGAGRRPDISTMVEKGSTRDHAQVFANGGIGGVLVFMSSLVPSIDWYLIYLGSLAAVTADTWGTEIGLLARGRVFLVTSGRAVEPGTNGGVSWQGLVAGIGGSLVIGASSLFWLHDTPVLWLIVGAGVVGSFADSFLGATMQALYRCPVCGKDTERKIHCNNQPTYHVRGWQRMSNDAVNWICAFTGALFIGLYVGLRR